MTLSNLTIEGGARTGWSVGDVTISYAWPTVRTQGEMWDAAVNGVGEE